MPAPHPAYSASPVTSTLGRNMISLSKVEAQDWCRSRSIHLNDRGTPQPDFTDEQGFDFRIPIDTGGRIALSDILFRGLPSEQDTMIWITDWGIWPSGERMHVFDRFRFSYGLDKPLVDIPAFIHRASEREDALSFFTFPILFLYDCHVLSESGDTWIFISHDEVGWACVKSISRLESIKQYKAQQDGPPNDPPRGSFMGCPV